jgi:hypothetical protein
LLYDDGTVGAATVCNPKDGWRAFCSHINTGRMEVYDAALRDIGLALGQSQQERGTLQTPGVTKVAVFSDSQAAIGQT